MPKNRYGESLALNAVNAVLREEKQSRTTSSGVSAFCLDYVRLVVKSFCRDESLRSGLLGRVDTRPVATGFDDGDYLYLGLLRKTGLQVP